jgi:Flp pilus assembly protein TadG
MRSKLRRGDKGQILVWVALALPLLVLITAVAVDMSLIYMKKGRLANAVDSAVLTGVRNYGNGSASAIAQAQSLATDMFEANYGSTSPALTFTWCPNSSDPNCTQAVSLTVHAEAQHSTYFMRILPNLATWQLGDSAQATRSNLVMTVILDRSGSMASNDGGVALQSAVPQFIADFDNGVDHVALVSFSSTATTDVQMTTNFQSAIDSAVAGYNFVGGTFGGGAGTNPCTGVCQTTDGPPMNMADYQNSTVPTEPGYPITKVVVYFTDGEMNTIQDYLSCTNSAAISGATSVLYNYGGFDPSCSSGTCTPPAQTSFDFFNSANPDSNFNDAGGNDLSWWFAGSTGSTGGCSSPGGGGINYCEGNPPYSATLRCLGVTTFPSQSQGGQVAFNWTNITNDTIYRAEYTANLMRAESPVPTYFFTIGLGDVITGNPTAQALLSTIANDPNAANYGGTYNSSQPAGEFLIVPDCPSSQCTQELTQAFQEIATKVLLRLSQ